MVMVYLRLFGGVTSVRLNLWVSQEFSMGPVGELEISCMEASSRRNWKRKRDSSRKQRAMGRRSSHRRSGVLAGLKPSAYREGPKSTARNGCATVGGCKSRV